MAEFREVPEGEMPEPIKEVFAAIAQALDPTAGMSEEEKAEVALLQLVETSFNGNQALRDLADMGDGTRKKTPAELFASGIIVSLMRQGILPQHTHINNLYLRQIIAYWLEMFERYQSGEEL